MCRGEGSWRQACCSFSCLYGGSRAQSGDCHCSCPYTRTGRRCESKGAHVRLALVLLGESQDSFTYEKTRSVIQGLSELTLIAPEKIEVDTIKALDPQRRAQSINMVTCLCIATCFLLHGVATIGRLSFFSRSFLQKRSMFVGLFCKRDIGILGAH